MIVVLLAPILQQSGRPLFYTSKAKFGGWGAKTASAKSLVVPPSRGTHHSCNPFILFINIPNLSLFGLLWACYWVILAHIEHVVRGGEFIKRCILALFDTFMGGSGLKLAELERFHV